MKTEQVASLVVYDEAHTPINIILFEGKQHCFYTIERCGADEIKNLLNRNLIDKKI